MNGGTIIFSYDPLGRLYGDNRPGTANDRFYLYEDAAMIGYVLASTPASLARRFVHDQGSLGAPVAVYEGSGVALADQSYVLTDERGSVIGLAAGVTGAVQATDAYGPYGEGGDPANTSTYGYAGQLWHDRANLYSMRNRWYLPGLGRFMQTDPIGYQGGMNLYGYVGNDPVNYTDPWGLRDRKDLVTIVVSGARIPCAGTSFCSSGESLEIVGGGAGLGSGLDGAIGEVGISPESSGEEHEYEVDVDVDCSADQTFEAYLAARSAPGAGRPDPGQTERNVQLFGGDWIRQTINYSSRTILNETVRGRHRFDPGTVAIRIRPTHSGANITIVGRGSGDNELLNRAAFAAFFRGGAYAEVIRCAIVGDDG